MNNAPGIKVCNFLQSLSLLSTLLLYSRSHLLSICRVPCGWQFRGKKFHLQNSTIVYYTIQGRQGRWAGWAIAHQDFGRIEGAVGQQRQAALVLAQSDFQTLCHPCNLSASQQTLVLLIFNQEKQVKDGKMIK